MASFIKTRKKKIGAMPGSFIYVGEPIETPCSINVSQFNIDRFLSDVNFDDLSYTSLPDDFITWISVEGIPDSSLLQQFETKFNLHPLVLEDIINMDHRPKAEIYDDYIYLVLKLLDFTDNQITSKQISIVFGKQFIISFEEKKTPVFDPIKERILKNKGRIRKVGVDFLAYSLMDTIFDNYFILLEDISNVVEELENELIQNPSKEMLQKIHKLKREMIFFRKSVWPLRELISHLDKTDNPFISSQTRLFLRDLYDHIFQIMDTAESFREILTGMLDTYLSSLSNKLNDVMKILTIISTIFIPITFISSLYGMNFKYMPELSYEWGYPIVIMAMCIVGILMIIFFRKKKWI